MKFTIFASEKNLAWRSFHYVIIIKYYPNMDFRITPVFHGQFFFDEEYLSQKLWQ